MSLIGKIALTSFFAGILVGIVSIIVGILDDYEDGIWVPILVIGVLLAAILVMCTLFYLVSFILIKIWT